MTSPTPVNTRIEALDVLRGFALLGILLLNILGFGLLSAGYFNPMVGSGGNAAANLALWGSVEVLAEGAMRGLFSILFGAGIVLFNDTARGKTAALHYTRNFWLLVFGLFNAFVLLWFGDILIPYAIAAFLLYPARNASPRRLLISAGVLLVLISLMYAGTRFGLAQAEAAGNMVWTEFTASFQMSSAAAAEELDARTGSYLSAFVWTSTAMVETLLFVLPLYMLWDAVLFMLIGMALYKLGLLDASRSTRTYAGLCIAGFALGLAVNGLEVMRAVSADFHPLSVFPFAQWTYHFGRLGMALGYLGLIMIACRLGWCASLRARLAAVGRMALTNYLMHSAICALIFTGAGLGLAGALERWQLYPIVLAIWLWQLWFSPWWLARHPQGPVERLWRRLTYGR